MVPEKFLLTVQNAVPKIKGGRFSVYRLAIIEDEEVILDGLSKFYPWKDIGFQVVSKCTTAEDFFAFLESGGKVDAILSDICLPNMTGIDLAKRISEQYPDIIVVFLSGFTDFNYAKSAVSYGVFEYLVKPVKFDDLVSTFVKIHLKLDEKLGIFVTESSYYENIIKRIDNLIDENLRDISWKLVAYELNMSVSYLSYLYKQQTGRNFVDVVTKKKMDKALHLLKDSDMKIFEIADTLGYTNAKNFSRAFSLFFGKSPREFRQQ